MEVLAQGYSSRFSMKLPAKFQRLSYQELGRLNSLKTARFRERYLGDRSMWLMLLSFLLIIVGGLFFLPAAKGYWLADYFYWVRDLLNYDWREIPKLFLGDWPRTGEYRPLWSVSFVADLFIWGPDARGLHLTNIIFHM